MVFCYYLSTQNVLLTRPEKKFALDSRDGEFFFWGGGQEERGEGGRNKGGRGARGQKGKN